MNLAEGDVLVGPEVLVPVFRILPQVSQTFLQLGFILGDAINNRPEVGKRVRRPDPVVRGAGSRSESRSLQALHAGSIGEAMQTSSNTRIRKKSNVFS